MSSRLHRGFVVVGLGAFAALAGCTRPVDPSAPPSATLRGDERDAAYRIAIARCVRIESASCSASQTYPSRDACIQDKLEATALELPLGHCEDSVDKKNLERCVNALLEEPCGSGARVEACRNDYLCPGRAPQEGASLAPATKNDG
jgi:hypothetical protein